MELQKKFKGAIFDLDGVLVDTAKYHYLAWKSLANELGFDFSIKDNEQLKGVSRMASLNILLEIGKLEFTQEEKEKLADIKNSRYVEYLKDVTPEDLLPGSLDCLKELRRRGAKIALGSASKNAPRILNALDITKYFDTIVDGNHVSKAKPDPEVFVLGAQRMGLAPEECIVFEDAQAGIKAANTMGSFSVAVGSKENLKGGDFYIKDLSEFPIEKFF